MRTFATLALAGSYATFNPGEVLVGRTVANAQFLRALFRYSSFERFVLFVGESGDVAGVKALLAALGEQPGRTVITRNLLELPSALAAGELDVLHHNSHTDRLFDLFYLRDRFATRSVPVSGQIHSLSYARIQQEYLKAGWLAPSATDAVFCSSTAGRRVVQEGYACAALEARARGMNFPDPAWDLPVVPLGVDAAALEGGDRAATRARLQIPADAFVIASLARFTEYDKMDLFPLIQVLERLVRAPGSATRPVYLLLAGARQGTKTPEMLTLWSRVFQVQDRVRLQVDFPEADKKHLLAAADVFVSPCDNPQETYGQTVVEAMAAGLPVVVSDFDGYRDTVSADVGIRVPTRALGAWDELSDLAPILYDRPLHLFLGQSIEVDLTMLEAALRLLHQDEPLRQQMAQAARQRARSLYDFSQVIPQYEAVWRRLRDRPFTSRTTAHHPLRLDYQRVFGHYLSEPIDRAQQVVRSEVSRRLCTNENHYVVYPELQNLFTNVQILEALSTAESPLSIESLLQTLTARWPARPPWWNALLVSWLLKHALLRRV